VHPQDAKQSIFWRRYKERWIATAASRPRNDGFGEVAFDKKLFDSVAWTLACLSRSLGEPVLYQGPAGTGEVAFIIGVTPWFCNQSGWRGAATRRHDGGQRHGSRGAGWHAVFLTCFCGGGTIERKTQPQKGASEEITKPSQQVE
jgi:hypothetical protein